MRCPFDKPIISARLVCSLAEKYSIAEREGVHCTDARAQRKCLALVEQLRDSAKFALKLTDRTVPLPHGKEMKIKCGGLYAMQQLLSDKDPVADVPDVHQTLNLCQEKYLQIANMPFSEIVKFISAYKVR